MHANQILDPIFHQVLDPCLNTPECMVDRRNTAVEDLIRSQLQTKKQFTDQHSSHFKLCMAVNFKLLQKKSAPSFDLAFSTAMTNLKLFHVVEKKCTMLDKLSRSIAICEFDEKFDV